MVLSLSLSARTRAGLLLLLVVWVVILCYTMDGNQYAIQISLSNVKVADSSSELEVRNWARDRIPRWADSPLPHPRKVILFTTRPHLKSTTFARTTAAELMCPRCIFTHDQSRWNESDAILFNGRFLEKPAPLKAPGQVWIYFYREVPSLNGESAERNLEKYRNLFNWTMTYRLDSDVFMPYADVVLPTEPPAFDRHAALERLNNKKGLGAWIVSNCNSNSNREELVKNLAKHIPVDIYGKCGQHKCATSRSQSVGTDCRDELSKNYKFYLAFENSLCQDYVTEKFFDVLDTDMVPIVYGRVNYSEFGIPRSSYINVDDFQTVQQLADHILWLDKNPDAYLNYLESRAGITSRRNLEIFWCRICDKLFETENNGQSHAYEDLREWWKWRADRMPECVPPSEIVNTV